VSSSAISADLRGGNSQLRAECEASERTWFASASRLVYSVWTRKS
jgi:hypothetical protein